MSFSAADLQKKHELEGAPDPFPAIQQQVERPKASVTQEELDTSSEISFPSLVSSAPASTVAPSSAWGGPRIKPAVSKTPVLVDTFTLASIDLSNSGKDGKSATLGEVIKQVTAKYKVKVEASTNQLTRQQYTFHLKAESQKELDKAKRSLVALLSPQITHYIDAPASTIPTIIGAKGATLKAIRDQTSVRVDIPKKDETSAANGNANGNGQAHDADDDEEPIIRIKLTGPQLLVDEAEEMLKQIISSKISKATQRVRDIPAHILPFVKARRGQFHQIAGVGAITLALNPQREIVATGDREAVIRAIEAIKQAIETLKTSLVNLRVPINAAQHRLVTGPDAEEALMKSRCSVTISDEGTAELWAETADLPTGLKAALELAMSKHVTEIALPAAQAKQIAVYLQKIAYQKTVETSFPNVKVYLPAPTDAKPQIDIVGEKQDTVAAGEAVKAFLAQLSGGTREAPVDWLLHRVVSGKNAKKLKQFHESHNVSIYFPAENLEQSSVLLVYDPLSASASKSVDDKKKNLDEVEKELLKMAKDAADVKSQTIPIEKRWHEAVVGKNNTTLNAIIGEDTTLSIKVAAEAGDASTDDVILVRGISGDVDRAVQEILKIVENAKNDEIVNSYVTEFDIDREYVGRIVGAQGAGVNKLRDQLGVKVDVSDEVEEGYKESSGSKKKKQQPSHQKSKIKITGRKENVEEAKKRILAQIERLADETSEILKIPNQYHASLIGQNGKYAIRLEEKYSVKITFPRQTSENGEGRTREQLKADEVLVKGGKKGVAGAKSELMEALEFEKEANNVLNFTVPTRCIARILGRAGASINEIKDDTGAQIDIDKSSGDGPTGSTPITVRGTKKAIAAAKTAILAIADQVAEEKIVNLTIESKYHRNIIGAGGSGLRELITRCGGPTDPKQQAGLVRFPRQGEPSDDVRIRGEPKVVDKVKVALEAVVAELRDRVILGVEIPAAQHRALIGRGGQHLNELQDKYSVQIQFPGSRSYSQVGEPSNAEELSAVDQANIVKVSGSQEACEKALAELKANVKAPPVEGPSSTVSVPIKYVNVIAQQGGFFRTLRTYGVQVEQQAGGSEKSSTPTRPAPTTRIDDEANGSADHEWEIDLNYKDAEEGETTWTLKARDQAGLARAEKAIQDAIHDAEAFSHVGFLTLSDRSVFPRIVGAKGANVARLRNETGTDITVSRDNNTIVIVGPESGVLSAKDAILKMTGPREGSGRRRND